MERCHASKQNLLKKRFLKIPLRKIALRETLNQNSFMDNVTIHRRDDIIISVWSFTKFKLCLFSQKNFFLFNPKFTFHYDRKSKNFLFAKIIQAKTSKENFIEEKKLFIIGK